MQGCDTDEAFAITVAAQIAFTYWPPLQAGYISQRWSATSGTTMSMHNFPSEHAVAIEVTTLRGLPDNARGWRCVRIRQACRCL